MACGDPLARREIRAELSNTEIHTSRKEPTHHHTPTLNILTGEAAPAAALHSLLLGRARDSAAARITLLACVRCASHAHLHALDRGQCMQPAAALPALKSRAHF